jgi:hypothetical protein
MSSVIIKTSGHVSILLQLVLSRLLGHAVFGYGRLENSILSRSLDHVKQAIANDGVHNFDCPRGGLYPLDFALGWPDGLQWLLEVGYRPEGTLELSISVGDVESTRILLETAGFALAGNPVLLYVASRSDKLDMHNVVVNALKQSRDKLRHFALEHLSVYGEDCTDLLEEKVLDARAVEVWNKLLHTPIRVPTELNPGNLSSVYSVIDADSQVGFLNALYDHGFESIDGSGGSNSTPFQSLVMERAQFTSNRLATINWFIQKQANMDFITAGSFPNVLFYFAIGYSELVRGITSVHSKSTLDGLVSEAAASCNPLCTDGCSCYCSSLGGCLPLHKIWICNPRWRNHEGCKLVTTAVLKSALDNWVQSCRLDTAQTNLYYQEMCRLEIFERLGMAHTCCTYTASWESVRSERESMENEEQRRLQDEDSSLEHHLTKIMEAFKQLRSEYLGDMGDFWVHWWQRVDEILPELTPEERCRCKGLNQQEKNFNALFRERVKTLANYRADVERDAQELKGFWGKEFGHIIKMHLVKAQSLSSQS